MAAAQGGFGMTKEARYKLCYGRFGAYYYDRQKNKELDLEDVLRVLNLHEKSPYFDILENMLIEINNKVTFSKNQIKVIRHLVREKETEET